MRLESSLSRKVIVLAFAVGVCVACSSTSSKSSSPSPSTSTSTSSTTASTTTSTTSALAPGTQRFRIGLLAPGSYEADTFGIPYQFTTTKPWTGIFKIGNVIFLSRGLDAANSGGAPANNAEVVVTTGLIQSSTAADAIEKAREGCAAYIGPPTATTFMGAPALQVEGTTTELCDAPIFVPEGQLQTPPQSTARIVATRVAGHTIVLFADAAAATWPTFRPELDALISSMKVAP